MDIMGFAKFSQEDPNPQDRRMHDFHEVIKQEGKYSYYCSPVAVGLSTS